MNVVRSKRMVRVVSIHRAGYIMNWAWQICTNTGSVHTCRQRSHTKQWAPRRRQQLEKETYPKAPYLSSIQSRHKHCGALLITDQQANWLQLSHLMKLQSNEQITWNTLGSTSTYRRNTETAALRCRKCLSVLTAMAAKRHLFLPYQRVDLRVTVDGQDLTTMSQTNRLKLDLVQNEAKGVILGTTTGTPTKTMWLCWISHRYRLDRKWSRSGPVNVIRFLASTLGKSCL